MPYDTNGLVRDRACRVNRAMVLFGIHLSLVAIGGLTAAADDDALLPGMERLSLERPLDEVMVEGIDRHLMDLTTRSAAARDRLLPMEPDAIAAIREQLRALVGAVDPRLPTEGGITSFERYGATSEHVDGSPGPAAIARGPDGFSIRVSRVRIDVLDGVTADGLMVEPSTPPLAFVVALGDAAWTPEQFVGIEPGVAPSAQLPRRLAEQSITVFVPTMIDRGTRLAGNPDVGFTNQSHREFLHRTGFELGRHPIGYEIQRVLAAVDRLVPMGRPVGVAGVGEGGLVTLFAAALDERIDSALVSGSFGPAEDSWRQPIDRSIWRRLEAHGDAELAALVSPRRLVVEAAGVPSFESPPPTSGRSVAAPGRIETLAAEAVRDEFARAEAILVDRANGSSRAFQSLVLAASDDGVGPPGSRLGVNAFLEGLGVTGLVERPTGSFDALAEPCHERRHERQFRELLDHVQRRMETCWRDRERLWKDFDASSRDSRRTSVDHYREIVRGAFIGRLEGIASPLAPRCRRLFDGDGFTAWEITCDVTDDIIAGGLLLVPSSLEAGERRAVIVCQHGLEGRPIDTVVGKEDPAWQYYKGFAADLARKGYVVLAPQNPYRGGDRFRTLQRKAWPLGLSLFAVITAQHERLLDLVETLPFADASRIGFYGLSYGGKTAMRVPALVPRYALSICSGDFNQWVRKVASIERSTCYPFHGEYEITEWNMGGVADYAELAWLIAPRPFMVERGRRDGCAPDEWVAAEFARVQPVYERLGLPDHAAIEWFDGPHTINGVGTFDFLARFLPPRAAGDGIDSGR